MFRAGRRQANETQRWLICAFFRLLMNRAHVDGPVFSASVALEVNSLIEASFSLSDTPAITNVLIYFIKICASFGHYPVFNEAMSQLNPLLIGRKKITITRFRLPVQDTGFAFSGQCPVKLSRSAIAIYNRTYLFKV
jgi:hypothetical protein